MTRPGSKRFVRMAVDILLAVILVLVMATALVEEAPHEFLGIALIVLMCVHLVLNRRWFATLARGRWSALRVIHAIVIVGLVACLIGQAVSAVILSKHALAFLPALPGTAIARQAHMLCSYWMFAFAAAHAGLQMRSVFTSGRIRTMQPAARIAVYALVAVIAVLGVISFVQLNLPSYLTGSVQFAAGMPNVLLACVLWTAAGVFVAVIFHALRLALGRKPNRADSQTPGT